MTAQAVALSLFSPAPCGDTMAVRFWPLDRAGSVRVIAVRRFASSHMECRVPSEHASPGRMNQSLDNLEAVASSVLMIALGGLIGINLAIVFILPAAGAWLRRKLLRLCKAPTVDAYPHMIGDSQVRKPATGRAQISDR